VILGIFLGYTTVYSIGCLLSAPYAARAIWELRISYGKENSALVPAMASTIKYSRITSIALAVSMIIPTL
jgi:1,4-dihydroxy-2-naphthoate octaprenyltransferase